MSAALHIDVASGALLIRIPMRVESRKNLRESWTMRWRRESEQKKHCWAHLVSGLQSAKRQGTVPSRVTFCRVGKRLLDDDNIAFACSHLRDIVARTFGVDDGPSGPIAWRYTQRLGEWAVEIQLEF